MKNSVWYRRPWPLAGAGLWLMLQAPSAWAATVDLTAAIASPVSTPTLTEFMVTYTYGNGRETATNAGVSIPLPANLYDVRVVGVEPVGAATCPAPSELQPLPTGTTAAGTAAITATIASLPPGTQCRIQLGMKALSAASYTFRSTVAAGPADVEGAPATNAAVTNLTLTRPAVALSMDKTIVSGADLTSEVRSGARVWRATGNTLVYKLSYTNHSSIDLPLRVLGDEWADSEILRSAARHAGSTTQLGGAGHAACESTGAGVCPEITPATPNFSTGTGGAPLHMHLSANDATGFAGAVLAAGETMDIYYTRIYDPAICGEVQLSNSARWTINSRLNAVNATFRAPNPGGSTEIRIDFPQTNACTGVTVQPRLQKTLTGVTKSDGSAAARSGARNNFLISDDGDTAHYTITLTGDSNHSLPVTLSDTFRNAMAGTHRPTFLPATADVNGSAMPSVRYTMTLESCEITPAATGDPVASTCPAGGQWGLPGNTPKVLYSNRSASENATITQGSQPPFILGKGEVMTFKVNVRYNITRADAPLALCRAKVDDMVNDIRMMVDQRDALAAGRIYQGGVNLASISERLELLTDNTPRCVNVTATKTLSTSDPQAGEEFSFYLDYTNNTASSTGILIPAPANIAFLVERTAEVNPLRNLQIEDALGSHFTASAISCETTSGTATAPTVSLADITGPDNTFRASIPSMDSGAVVRCTVTGKVDIPSSYVNETSIALPDSVSNTLHDVVQTDNVAHQNYSIIGPQVEVKKEVVSTAFVPGGDVTFTVSANNVSPTVAAPGTLVSDEMPATLLNARWTCAASGGAACPRASGTGNLNESIAIFPPGSSLVYTITGQAAANALNVINTASITPRAGGSCINANGVPELGPCTSTAGIGAGVAAPHIAIQKVRDTAADAVAGEVVQFTITAAPIGLFAADGTRVTDPVAAGFESQSWTCAATGGAVCPQASGTGGIDQVIATFPAGSSVVYTVQAQLPDNLLADTDIRNTATVVPPAGVDCGPCTADAEVSAIALRGAINISKTASAATVEAGQSVTFTVTATASGNRSADGARVTDPLAAGFESQSWSCTATGGAVCPVASADGSLDQTITTFPAGGSVSYAVVAKVPASLAANTTLTNTASVVPPNTYIECTACTASASVAAKVAAEVTISKTAAAASVAAGEDIAFTIQVNASKGDAHGTRISDPLAAGVQSQSWSCVATGGAVCPQASGDGALDQVIATFPAGGGLTYTVVAKADAGQNLSLTVTNTATLTPGVDARCTTCEARAVVTVQGSAVGEVKPVPLHAPWMLWMLAALMAGLAVRVAGTGVARKRS